MIHELYPSKEFRRIISVKLDIHVYVDYVLLKKYVIEQIFHENDVSQSS